jgi:outer membrane protein assembly factor BamB
VTGDSLFTVSLSAIASGPAVEDGGRLFVTTRDGRVAAWVREPWTPLWVTNLEAPLVAGPRVAGSDVIQGSPRGHLMILDRETGEERMMMRHPELLVATPSATATTIAAGGHKGTLVLFGRTP